MTAREARGKIGSRKTRKQSRKALKNQRTIAKISADKIAAAKRAQVKRG